MVNKVSTANPSDNLKQRGIYEQAIQAGWLEGLDGYWHFPVIDIHGNKIATRAKAYPETLAAKKPKFLWPDGKPANPDANFYILSDTKQAIQDAGGLCYLANGESAFHAYRSAGYLNVICTTLSEIATPENLIPYLQALGITKLINIADKDNAGTKAAAKWRDALRDSQVEYQAKQWPAYLPDKADANDLWQYVNFDKNAFIEALNNCQALILPETPVKPEKRVAYVPSSDIDYSNIFQQIGHAVLDALSARGYLTGKKYHNFYQTICIHHAEKEASAGYDPNTGVFNCHVCGKHSLKENAFALGIDWQSYFPKREGKKTPKKADLQALSKALEELQAPQADQRSYEDILADEIMGREIAYDAKQFIGFGQWKALPLAIVSAVLNLCNGRSNLALFLAKMHSAMLAGEIGTFWTEADAMRVTEMSRNCVNRCQSEAEHLGFVSFLSGNYIYIDSIQGKETKQKGRPAAIAIAELNKEEIIARLSRMLEIQALEKASKKALAMPSMQMARQLGASENQLKEWRDKIKACLNDSANKSAKIAFDLEMFGNGKNWKGWLKALETDYAPPLDYSAMQDCQDLRAALLKWWITKRDVNSREELCRLLGCTDPVIDKLFALANITTERQQKKVEFKAPETVRQMAYEWNKQQRDLSGVCWKGGYKIKGEDGWTPIEADDYLDTFASFAGRIEKVYMLIVTPSKQRLMTEDEIAKRDAKQAEEMAQESPKTTSEVPKEASIESVKPERAKTSYTYQKWDKHSYAFLYRQLQLLIHCFTQAKLVGHSVMDKQGNQLASGELKDLFAWLSANASENQLRKVKSFYGKGYDEDKDLAALQALVDERKAKLGIIESVSFEDMEDMPEILQQMELIPVVTPVVKTENKAPMGYVYGAIDNPEYYDYLNNPYLEERQLKARIADVERWSGKKVSADKPYRICNELESERV